MSPEPSLLEVDMCLEDGQHRHPDFNGVADGLGCGSDFEVDAVLQERIHLVVEMALAEPILAVPRVDVGIGQTILQVKGGDELDRGAAAVLAVIERNGERRAVCAALYLGITFGVLGDLGLVAFVAQRGGDTPPGGIGRASDGVAANSIKLATISPKRNIIRISPLVVFAKNPAARRAALRSTYGL